MTDQEIIDKSILLCIQANKQKAEKKTDEVGLHDLYRDSVDMAESIKNHAIKGKFPKKLFEHRSPNETPAEATYIEKNYKNLTNPVFADYIATIGRPMGDGNWSINYKEDKGEFKTADQTFQSYVEEELPVYGSLENFIKFILPSIKSIDANGFLVVRPKEIKYEDTENGKVISNELHAPTVLVYESKAVVAFEPNEYYLFLTNEKSIVGAGKREGSIYELHTPNAIYFIVQHGTKADNTFNVVPFYQHNLGECQVRQLMGVPHLKEDKILWQSPFFYATDLLDLVAMNGNWEQAMMNKCAFPIPVMLGNVCEFTDEHGTKCDGGTIYKEGGKVTCPSCNGQGLTSRLGPLRTLLIKPTTKFEQGEERSTLPPLQYVSPEIHTLEFIHKKVESDTLKARSILKLRNKNTSVTTNDGSVTATEIVDDAKGMYAFIKPISDQIFTLYEFCLNSIGKQRYGDNFETPELSYPKTFDFKSAEDYLIDIANAIKNGLPPSFIQTILLQYINAYYGDNAKANSIFKLVVSADRLFGLSQDEINMQLARGTIAKWESILHSSILTFINDSIRANEKFVEGDLEAQIKTLQDIAKKMIAEMQVPEIDITKTMLPGNGGGVVEDVDVLGKLPLALQQLALARERANTAGDTVLSNKIAAKMQELLKVIDP